MTHPGEKLPAIGSQPLPEQGMVLGGWMGAGCSRPCSSGGTTPVFALPATGGWLAPWAEREGGRKGKELRMGRIGGNAYLPRRVSLRKGRAGHKQILLLAPGWGLTASNPTTCPLGSQFAASRGCEPQTGTQRGIHYWGQRVPQHLAELKRNLFSRTAPENQPRTAMVPEKVGPHYHR